MKLRLLLPLLFVAVLLGLGGYVAAGPYLAINGIERALREQNLGDLERYVDFPKLRENLKPQIDSYLLRQAGVDDNTGWLGSVARSISDRMSQNGVSLLVRPNGIAAILQGRSAWQSLGDQVFGVTPPDPDLPPADPTPNRSTGAEPAALIARTERRYESVSRFTATAHHADASTTVFVFERQGLRWKLTDIRLPL